MRKYANSSASDGEDIRKRRRSALIKLAVLMTFSLIVWIFSSLHMITKQMTAETA